MKRNKNPRYILDENDLEEFILDSEAFAAFGLSEREQFVVKAHIINGFTFKEIGAIDGGVSDTMANRVYLRALKKIRNRLKENLKTTHTRPIAKTTANKIYIAGGGVSSYFTDANQSPLAVGWKKAV